MRQSIPILLSLLLVHCSQEPETEHIQILDKIPQHIQEIENLTIFPGDSEPLYEIELIPEQTFGEEGEPYLTHIAGSVVDENERVLIWDIDTHGGSFPPPHNIYVYNTDGTYYTQIGRGGRGPGEFGMLISIYANAGKVFVLDAHNQRLNLYNKVDYSFERSILVEHWNVHNHESVKDLEFARLDTRSDGNHLAVFSEWGSVSGSNAEFKYLLINTDGDVLNPVPMKFSGSFKVRPQADQPSPPVELFFMGRTITDFSDDGTLYSAWTRDFLIKKFDANGIYQSAIYYPLKGASFDLNEYTETIRYNTSDIRNAIENSDEEVPETNPALDNLMVDDENRIWAAVPMDEQRKNYEWWILSPTGELLAKLQRPRDKAIFDIKNGYLYAKEIDEDTDVEFVVKYRIELTERK